MPTPTDPPEELRTRLAAVRLLALDVDGVLTDGGVIYDDAGHEAKRFHIHDGLGMVLARFGDLPIAWITGRRSLMVERRARELKVSFLRQSVGDKVTALSEIAAELGLTPAAVAYMGDDLNDLPALRWAGIALAPANAFAPEVRKAADHITGLPGGSGAVREAIELLLTARGNREAAVSAYLAFLSAPVAETPTQ